VHFVIMGCGRVGASMATQLDRMGHSVAIIDQLSDAFRRLPTEFNGRKVKGVGFDRDALEQAGIDEAYAFAAVSNGDNSNIVAARVPARAGVRCAGLPIPSAAPADEGAGVGRLGIVGGKACAAAVGETDARILQVNRRALHFAVVHAVKELRIADFARVAGGAEFAHLADEQQEQQDQAAPDQ